jgi:hypothetical protein
MAATLLRRGSREPGPRMRTRPNDGYPTCPRFRHRVELFVKYLITQLARLHGTDEALEPTHPSITRCAPFKGKPLSAKRD